MPQPPNNQMPLVPQLPPRTPSSVADTIGTYAKAFVWIAFWLIVAATTLAAMYVALRGLLWGVQLVTNALGI